MEENNINKLNKNECCGCSACFSVCHFNAIKMSIDSCGFLYPIIDKNLCINCGQCLKACQIINKQTPINKTPYTIVCQNKDAITLSRSRSGGVFYEIARYFIENDGYIVGCIINDDFCAEHIVSNQITDIQKMQGSKYIQSDLKTSFIQTNELLMNGKKVLFTGTGCQIYGLLLFLNKKGTSLNGLLTCDTICHGVPSPQVWKHYLEHVSSLDNKKISSVIFRNKELFGWKDHIETIIYEDGTYHHTKEHRFYQKSFFRNSCYSCKFTTINRLSDITLGDCWGIEDTDTNFDINKGVSLILLHTPKGRNAFEHIKTNLVCNNVDISNFLQPQLKEPTKKPHGSKRFWRRYSKSPYKAVAKHYFKPTVKERILLTISGLVHRHGK